MKTISSLVLITSLFSLSITTIFSEDLRERIEKTRTTLNDLSIELLSESPNPAMIHSNLERLRALSPTSMIPTSVDENRLVEVAWLIGKSRAATNHTLATAMIQAIENNQTHDAQVARSLIELPRHGNAVEGSIILSQFENSSTPQEAKLRLLAKDYGLWQTTRIHRMLDRLQQQTATYAYNPIWIALQAGEIDELASFPKPLIHYFPPNSLDPSPPTNDLDQEIITKLTSSFKSTFPQWRDHLLSTLPRLMDTAEVARQEKLLLKLIRLIPKEYRAGVREGEIIVPLEYRHAKSFAEQSAAEIEELQPFWKKDPKKSQASESLEKKVQQLIESIDRRLPIETIQNETDQAIRIMGDEIGIIAKKSGQSKTVIEETYLEIRESLRKSLQYAQQGNWREAESSRQEAYTTFDLEIEMRLLPRDPLLAKQSEQRFIEGIPMEPGIKALLDRHATGEPLEAGYNRLFEELNKTELSLKIGISSSMVILSTISIFSREGLEAVTILAALLAGFRGSSPSQIQTRKRIITGVWLALAVTLLTFGIMQYVVQSLSRYGEILEAIISILAVITLLFVTNWVFHKYYWVQWNSTLRGLGKKANQVKNDRWEKRAMIGVGFLTIYREGFEISLFLQTLILEGGWGPVLIGILCGTTLVGTVGFLIFKFGSKLPYRKLLVMTGGFVVLLLMTFTGSTIRLFQTVGWISVHPIEKSIIPSWAGVWLGLYPSWEGLLAPLSVVLYVGGAWLFVKFQGLRINNQVKTAVAL